MYIGTLATDEHRGGCLEVQTVFPTTGSRYGWRDAFADIVVYQGHIETLGGVDGLIVHEVGHATVVFTVVVHAEQTVVSAEPVIVVLVNALATNLQLYVLEQLLGRVEGSTGGILGEHELDHDVGDQITVTGDLGGHFVAVCNGTINRLLDRLHSEVCVAPVNSLEKSDLGVTGEVNVLGTVSYEL